MTIQTTDRPHSSSRNHPLLSSQQQEELEELKYIAALTLIKNQKLSSQAFMKNNVRSNFKRTDILQGLNPMKLLPERERELLIQTGQLI